MAESLTGQFLVSGKSLRDPNFHKTVVLVVEHNDQGAMGLVVNRPTTVTVQQALAEHFDVEDVDELVFYGGPVEPSALFVVHGGVDGDDGHPVVPGVYVGSSAEVFAGVVREAVGEDGRLRYRIFAGCSGWGPGQLEGEIARGDWLLVPATAELTFHDDPYIVWESARDAAAKRASLLPDPPSNPEWN